MGQTSGQLSKTLKLIELSVLHGHAINNLINIIVIIIAILVVLH